MKKIATILLAILILSSVVFAEGQKGPGSEMEDKKMVEEDKGMEQKQEEVVMVPMEKNMEQMQERVQTRAQSPEELRQMIQSRQQRMNQEIEGMDERMQDMYRNQNKVREAVHALVAMEGLVGDVGPQIREVARNFNNSVQSTIKAEERIQKRSGFARFFTGGDRKNAEEIEKEVSQNRQRIQELMQLREQCDCEEGVRTMMQEQIQNMEQEQSRLQELAQKEKKSKGLFGWIWK